jgi:hypothetical protein
MQVLLEWRRRVAERLSSMRIRLSDLRARYIDCLAEESRSQLLTAIEQEAEVRRQLAGKLLQLEATVLARRIRPRTPSKKAVDDSRGGSGPKSDRLGVRLALLDGSR